MVYHVLLTRNAAMPVDPRNDGRNVETNPKNTAVTDRGKGFHCGKPSIVPPQFVQDDCNKKKETSSNGRARIQDKGRSKSSR